MSMGSLFLPKRALPAHLLPLLDLRYQTHLRLPRRQWYPKPQINLCLTISHLPHRTRHPLTKQAHLKPQLPTIPHRLVRGLKRSFYLDQGHQ